MLHVCKNDFFHIMMGIWKKFNNPDKYDDNLYYIILDLFFLFFFAITIYDTSHSFRMHQSEPCIPSRQQFRQSLYLKKNQFQGHVLSHHEQEKAQRNSVGKSTRASVSKNYSPGGLGNLHASTQRKSGHFKILDAQD